MIDIAREPDGPQIVAIAAEAGVFSAEEAATVQELWDDYLQHGEKDYAFRVYREGDRVLGFTCHGRRDLAEGVYDLFWIATAQAARQRGIGRALLECVEEEIRQSGGRLVIAETSGTPAYTPTRAFYLSCGYQAEATIRDFYHPGDDLVMFTKHLV
jgi:ribosomal protein S18 acetylase RimI-like enzyme